MDIAVAIASAGVSRSDAEVLLAYILDCDRAHIIAHPERVLSKDVEKRWDDCTVRRRGGEPVAYITGEREFYGRVFHVDRRVHIPRPSTENLVTMTLDFLRNPRDEVRELETGVIGVARILRPSHQVQTVVDVCTGSGCIAVTIALERPDLDVLAIDIDPDALVVAQENARRLGVNNVRFIQSNLLDKLQDPSEPYIIVSNPPYLSDADIKQNPDLHFEPRRALYGGNSRRSVIAQLEQAAVMRGCTGLVIEQMREA